MKKIILFIICAVLAFSNGVKVYAATYYVDQNHGVARDSNAGTSESSPWLTLGKAITTVVAGDTVIVKAGTYTDGSAQGSSPFSAFNPTNNGSPNNYITFRSEPALAAIIEARSWNPSGSSAYMAWGLNARNYIEIDGFKMTGGFRAYNCNYITIKNCELTGGHYPPDDTSINWGLAFSQTSNGLIQNNYVHDMRDSGNAGHNGGCFIIFGYSINNIIEYNTADGETTNGAKIYNAFGSKAGGYNDNIFRYNFGKNIVAGFFGIGNTAGTVGVYRNVIHNNIILGADFFIELYKMAHDFQLYNNTAYDCDYFAYAIKNTNTGLELWNNLAISTNKNFIRWLTYDASSNLPSDLLAYSNYNIDSSSNWYVKEASTVIYSLSQFKEATDFDDSSTSTMPIVIKHGGSSPEDYKRTSYHSDGRGGAYASVIGAYITGNEVIGYSPYGVVDKELSSPSAPREFVKDVQ